MSFKTDQEEFWAGKFGDEYIERNKGGSTLASNISFFAKILKKTVSVSSVIEFGSNIGLNLEAIQRLLPNADLSAIEINKNAVTQLKRIKGIKVYHSSILDFVPDKARDFVLIKGVLIHINPDELQKVYELLHKTSNKYICIAEYYNPSLLR
ncbi:MAG: hypothetical protein PF482_19515 [Desulfobacteraceae bacterium]|nr:hypothetical protein [Desulfobacteraceae bacterium]